MAADAADLIKTYSGTGEGSDELRASFDVSVHRVEVVREMLRQIGVDVPENITEAQNKISSKVCFGVSKLHSCLDES